MAYCMPTIEFLSQNHIGQSHPPPYHALHNASTSSPIVGYFGASSIMYACGNSDSDMNELAFIPLFARSIVVVGEIVKEKMNGRN